MIGKKIDKKIMEVLKKHIGKKIEVEEILLGHCFKTKGVLKKVVDFEFIVILTIGIKPVNHKCFFIDYTSAIRRINSETGEILYNPLIPSDYARNGGLTTKEVNKIMSLSFGSQVAEEIDPFSILPDSSEDFLPK